MTAPFQNDPTTEGMADDTDRTSVFRSSRKTKIYSVS
jgi:hypothetical protein